MVGVEYYCDDDEIGKCCELLGGVDVVVVFGD